MQAHLLGVPRHRRCHINGSSLYVSSRHAAAPYNVIDDLNGDASDVSDAMAPIIGARKRRLRAGE
jgi:hypothetical protein